MSVFFPNSHGIIKTHNNFQCSASLDIDNEDKLQGSRLSCNQDLSPLSWINWQWWATRSAYKDYLGESDFDLTNKNPQEIICRCLGLDKDDLIHGRGHAAGAGCGSCLDLIKTLKLLPLEREIIYFGKTRVEWVLQIEKTLEDFILVAPPPLSSFTYILQDFVSGKVGIEVVLVAEDNSPGPLPSQIQVEKTLEEFLKAQLQVPLELHLWYSGPLSA